MRVAVLAITTGGKILSQKLCQEKPYDPVTIGPHGIQETIRSVWSSYDGFIFIMATGIVVRSIAPLLQNKKTDPCVVVLDEGANFAISLLSGHIGGGNSLATEVAKVSGAKPVISTASDVLGLTPVDLWARHNNLQATNQEVTRLSSLLVNNGKLHVFTDLPGKLPHDFMKVKSPDKAELVIAYKKHPSSQNVTLCPKSLVFGVGCNRGTSCDEIESAVQQACTENELDFGAIAALASIDLKSDEEGLREFADKYKLALQFYTATALNTVNGVTQSKAVFAATGAYAVAEPAALLAADTNTLIVEKIKWKNVTTAAAVMNSTLSARYS